MIYWVKGIVESNVNDIVVNCGMDNIDAICCVAGTFVSTTILLASHRQVYLGKVNAGTIVAITRVANSIPFLDGAANALRFLCFGSSMLHYIKYVVSW